MSEDEGGSGRLSPFKPDFDQIRKIRTHGSATIADLARVAGLDPGTDFRFDDWSDVDWRGTDQSRYDLSGSLPPPADQSDMAVPVESPEQPEPASQADGPLGDARIVTGIQPVSNLHLGNYFAIRDWTSLQNEAQLFLFIADLHAIVVWNDPARLQAKIRETAATLIACGIDPAKVVLFSQSKVHQHAELAWLLSCATSMGWLNHMAEFKKYRNQDVSMTVGLYTYPVLQAADVLLYQSTHLPFGAETMQQVELVRDIASRFNARYGEVFTVPDGLLRPNALRLMSLRDAGTRMTRSDPSDKARVNLTDQPDVIVRKIRKAKTDSALLPDSLTALSLQPEVANLVSMYAELARIDFEAVLSSFASQGYGALKAALAEIIIETLRPVRERMVELRENLGEVDRILAKGAEQAAATAAPTLAAAYRAVGLR